VGLLDELHADAEQVRRKKPCRVYEILEALSGKDRDELAQALDRKSGYMHSSLARVLSARGLDVTEGTVAHHRNGKCSCEPVR
jgi:hypothetical protein